MRPNIHMSSVVESHVYVIWGSSHSSPLSLSDYAELLAKVVAPGADPAAATELRKRLAWKAFQVFKSLLLSFSLPALPYVCPVLLATVLPLLEYNFPSAAKLLWIPFSLNSYLPMQHCSSYDSQVSEWLWGQVGAGPAPMMTVPMALDQTLRCVISPFLVIREAF